MRIERLGILTVTALLAFPLLASSQVASDPQPSTQTATRSPSDIAREEANKGDPEEQLRLGFFYEAGFDDVPQSCVEAIKWYRKSADQGNPDAPMFLAGVYDNGVGLIRDCQDHTEAVKLYRRLADQGNGTAQDRLAELYESGDGISQDHVEAMKWFKKALDRKDYSPYYRLMDMYYRRRGVQQDLVKALMWAFLLADAPTELRNNGGPPQPTSAQSIVEIASKMNPAQIAESERLAQEWKLTMTR